jgi:hypothetical protein
LSPDESPGPFRSQAAGDALSKGILDNSVACIREKQPRFRLKSIITGEENDWYAETTGISAIKPCLPYLMPIQADAAKGEAVRGVGEHSLRTRSGMIA